MQFYLFLYYIVFQIWPCCRDVWTNCFLKGKNNNLLESWNKVKLAWSSRSLNQNDWCLSSGDKWFSQGGPHSATFSWIWRDFSNWHFVLFSQVSWPWCYVTIPVHVRLIAMDTSQLPTKILLRTVCGHFCWSSFGGLLQMSYPCTAWHFDTLGHSTMDVNGHI